MKNVKKVMAAALVGAMAVTGTVAVNHNLVVTEAADSVLPTNSPSISVQKTVDMEAGTVQVVLSWNSETMRTFDYGVLFDAEKLEFDSMELAPAFLEAYQWDGAASEGGAAAFGKVEDETGQYITFGGVYYGEQSYKGEVATLNFKVKEGAQAAGILNIVKDSSTYATAAEMAAATPFKTVNLDSTVMMGDVNEDEKINSDDAVEILKNFAGLPSNVNEAAADVNGDDKINSDDAVEVLKYFAGLPSALD